MDNEIDLLTGRERKILDMIAWGMADKEIAVRLSISAVAPPERREPKARRRSARGTTRLRLSVWLSDWPPRLNCLLLDNSVVVCFREN